MTDLTLRSKARRIYKFKHPVHVPFIGISVLREHLKRAGIWEELPRALRRRVREAGWGGFTITRDDLDSIPDELWVRAAKAFNLEWHYAEEPCDLEPVVACA